MPNIGYVELRWGEGVRWGKKVRKPVSVFWGLPSVLGEPLLEHRRFQTLV